MTENNQDIYRRLRELEEKIQSGELSKDNTYKSINEAIKELKSVYAELEKREGVSKRELNGIITVLDKDMAIQAEKQSNVFYQLGQLEKRIEELEKNDDKSSENLRGLVEKIFMVIIGALVTYVFSMLKG